MQVPTPEELDAMMEGFGRSIAHQEEVVASEEEKRKNTVTKIWNESRIFNSRQREILLGEVINKLSDKSDLVTLVHLGSLFNAIETNSPDDTETNDSLDKEVKERIANIKRKKALELAADKYIELASSLGAL